MFARTAESGATPIFERSGANSLFTELYPESVVMAMICNAVAKGGKTRAFRPDASQLLPRRWHPDESSEGKETERVSSAWSFAREGIRRTCLFVPLPHLRGSSSDETPPVAAVSSIPEVTIGAGSTGAGVL